MSLRALARDTVRAPVALLISELGGRLRNVYRVLIFLPVLIAPVVVAVVWRWILQPT